jgi:hypothetical protein
MGNRIRLKALNVRSTPGQIRRRLNRLKEREGLRARYAKEQEAVRKSAPIPEASGSPEPTE